MIPIRAELSGSAAPAARALAPALGRLVKLLGLFFLGGVLAACAVPRSGPDRGELTVPAPRDLPYRIVQVTPAVASATRLDEHRDLPGAFHSTAPADPATLAPGDVVQVTVWESAESPLFGTGGAHALPEAEIDGAGFLTLPYAGRIRAAGRTPAELARLVRDRLAGQTLEPEVAVRAVEPRGRRVSVQGRVRAPGVYPLAPGVTRLLPMLARAGGVSEDPEVILLKLRRGRETGVLWLEDLYDEPENNVALRPGDAIIVERDRRSFTALGALGRQATIPFPRRALTLAGALGAVGGLLDSAADPTGVFVFRLEPPAIVERLFRGEKVGRPQRIVYLLDLTAPGGMFLAREFDMRDGDTIYVTTAPFMRWTKILQSVAPFVTFTGSAKVLAAGAG